MIYDIKQFLKNFFSSRLFVLSVVVILLFSMVLARIFYLQIIMGEEYQSTFVQLIEKEESVDAARGNIYDCNGVLLAYNELAYSVVISDTGTYSTSKVKNLSLNAEIAEIVTELNENKDELYNDFSIEINDDGQYEFTVSGTGLERFLADVFGESSYSDLGYNKDLGFNEQNATADEVMAFLASSSDECFEIDESYDKEMAYAITVIRYAIRQNRYAKYLSTTISKDVSDSTVAYINEHSDSLTGVSIEEDTIRKYNDSEYYSSLIGYTGKISTDEYNEKVEEGFDDYTTNDTIGKAGLEQYYEDQLRGTNGWTKFYVNTVGKKTEDIESQDPVAGNDLYLTIDSKVQKAAYLLLEQEIAGIIYTNVKKGNIPINDVYFALIDNNVLDLEKFGDEDASDTEKAVYKAFESAQESAISKVTNNLSSTSVNNNSMSEELLDYITYIIKMLKSNEVLLTSEIDTDDEVYTKWAAGKLSPKEYLNYCIDQQWIDITKLSVDDKYADTSELYDALCNYIVEQITADKAFSKIIYEYMINRGDISGKQLCIILFDQGVLDYDDDSVNNLSSGKTTAYAFLLDKINNIEITPAQLGLEPCSGSCVITDSDTGEIKALVSYPGYDANKLANGVDADYYAALSDDKSKPLYNHATQEKTAPGSTFKMVTATAGLAEGVIGTGSEIDCTGTFKEVSNEPKCWQKTGHGDLNVSQGLEKSCNVFFYTVGYRLSLLNNSNKYSDETGISYISKYASIYGLNETSGIEITENEPEIADEYPVMAAIGQSNNNLTTISLARYVTAVTTGNLYQYQLMSKIVDTDGNVLDSYTSESEDISGTLDSSQWAAIHKGMKMVCEDLDSFDGFDISIAGKTGTAQQTNHQNHALFVGYWPYEDPQYTIAVRITNGWTSHNAASAARNIVTFMEGEESLDDLLSVKAAGVNTSTDSSITD